MSYEEEGCTCDMEIIEPHSCPYSEEIDEDYEFECTCCPVCTKNCQDSI